MTHITLESLEDAKLGVAVSLQKNVYNFLLCISVTRSHKKKPK